MGDHKYIYFLDTPSSSSVSQSSMQSLQIALKEVKSNLLKAEEQIKSLNRCKIELSSELVNSKENNIKLQKEIAKCDKECQELREKLLTASNTNADLIEQLSETAIENHKLTTQMSILNDSTFHQGIFPYTYPWSPPKANNKCYPNSSYAFRNRKPQSYTESWEEVSHQLLLQMKSEMKNIEELGKQLATDKVPNKKSCSCTKANDPYEGLSQNIESTESSENSEDEEEMRNIKKLQMTNNVLKEMCLNQRQTMQSIFLKLYLLKKKDQNQLKELKKEKKNGEQLLDRRSDDSVRAYFNHQLTAGPLAGDGATGLVSQENERICPICQAVFPLCIPVRDFETHVVKHFDLYNTPEVTNLDIL